MKRPVLQPSRQMDILTDRYIEKPEITSLHAYKMHARFFVSNPKWLQTFICSARLQLLAASISCCPPSDWTTIDIPQTVRKNNCTHYFRFLWDFSAETNSVLLSLELLHPRIYHPEMCFDVVINFHFSAPFSADSGSRSCREGNRLHTMTHLISFYTDM